MVNAEKGSLKISLPSEENYSVFTAETRQYLTYLLGFIITISTLSATIYLPLIPMLSSHLSVSIQAINLTVTVYAVCQAISPCVFASLSDTYGRRPLLLILIGLYTCASVGLVFNSHSYAVLMTLRALQSVGGSATPPIAYGIVADVAVISERGKMLGPMLSTCNALSAFGPVVGGAVALSTDDYTWVFLCLLVVALLCFLSVGFTVPETARNVVGNGAEPVRGIWRTWWSFFRELKDKPCTRERNTLCEARNEKTRWRFQDGFAALRVISYPDAAMVLWMVASSYSIYYTFQVAIPVIFKELYGYNELEIGLAFLPGLAGMTVGGIIAGKLIDRNYARTASKLNLKVSRKTGENLREFPIECARYQNCILFILFETAVVAAYGWIVQARVHPSAALILQFFICAVSTLLSHTASALLVDIFPDTPSTAYASGQIMRCGLSAASAAIIEPLEKAVGRGWYFTIFSLFIGISCLVSVTASRLKGMRWRQKRQITSEP